MATNKSLPKSTEHAQRAPKKTKGELASFAVSPAVNGAALMLEYSKILGEQDINALIEAVRDTNKALRKNDLSVCENMLMSQALALQAMFSNLAHRAISQEYLKHMDAFLRFALKAQNQCRMTLETLTNIKNPPIVYAKQANIAHGHQQVNNAAPPSTHAEKNQTSPNELLETDTHEQQRLDTRAPGKAGRADQAMAAVGKRHRRKNG